MKIEVDKAYQTKEGDKVICIANYDDKVKRSYPEEIKQTIICTNEYGAILYYQSNGRYCRHEAHHKFDIVGEWKEPFTVSGWVNIFNNGRGVEFFSTKELADADNDNLVTKRIACVYVSGTNGVEPK